MVKIHLPPEKFSITTIISRLDPEGFIFYWPPGSRSIIQDYGSANPDPKEIFTDPQH